MEGMVRRRSIWMTDCWSGPDPVRVVLIVSMLLAGPALALQAPANGEDRASEEWEVSTSGLPTSGMYFGIAFGHIDKDGDLDLVASSDGDGLRVFLGDGDGGWTAARDHPTTDGGFSGICLGDYDEDGNMDLFAGSPGDQATDPKGLHVYKGDGTGTFTEVTSSSGLPLIGNWRGVAVGDVNKDGDLDLAATSGYGSANGIHVYIGDGDGKFTDQSTGLPNHQDRDSNIVLADFDDDGNMDLAAGGRPGTEVYLGNGGNGGTMTWTSSSVGLPNTRSAGISAADLDDDGLVDLVITAIEAGPGGGIYAYKNVREASLWNSISEGLPGSGDFVENRVGDLNGDGNMDIVATAGFDTSYGIHLYEGDGAGSWIESSPGLPDTTFYVGLDIGDYDGEGSLDIGVGKRTGGGGVEVWRNPRGAPDPSVPRVRIATPDGGQSWTGGSTHTVRWTTSYGTPPYSIALRYSTDGGTSFPNVIATDLSQTGPDTMDYDWTLPTIDMTTVRVSVGVTDSSATSVLDKSGYDIEIDSTPPEIEATHPYDGARDINIDTELRLTFSEGMDMSTSDEVFITGPGNPTLSSHAWGGNVLTVQTEGLQYGSEYMVTVPMAFKDDSDPGNTLSSDHEFSFETRPEPLSSPPIAVTGEDTRIDQNQVVYFDGTGSTDDVAVVEWSWSWDYNGQTAVVTGTSPTFVFALAGIYTVTLTVKDEEDQSSSAIMFVVVNDIEAPEIKGGRDISIDQHQFAGLDARGSTDNIGIDAYTWTFEYNGTSVVLSGPTQSYLFDIAGTYIVALTVADAEGNSGTDEFLIMVHDIEPPSAFSGEDQTIGEGDTITLNGSSSSDNVGIVNWTWTIDLDDRSVQLQGPIVTQKFSSPGRFYVELRVEDADGQFASDGFYVRVEEDEQGWFEAWMVAVLMGVVIIMLAIGAVRRRGRSLEVQPLEDTNSDNR